MFIWTGFDYRGESTPYGWPSINSYFGMYDMCGFAKDNIGYLKSWWGNESHLHLLPHWNWAGKEGDTIKVVAYSNLDEVELFVNNRSAGRKKMEKDSHLAWNVPYKAGSIKAIAYKNGKKQLEKTIETTGESVALKLDSHKNTLKGNGEDVAILSVSTTDKKGRQVPTASHLVTFEIEGPGKIIGVGNGDQTCLEPDKYIEKVEAISLKNMKAKLFDSFENRTEVTTQYNDSDWQSQREITGKMSEAKAIVYRGTLEFPENLEQAEITFFYNCIGNNQNLYLNGKLIGENLSQKQERYTLKLAKGDVKPGKNLIAIVATPFRVRNSWDNPNTHPGVVQVKLPAENYKRSLFSGLAQVIVQSTGEPGIIRVTAKAEGLTPAVLTIQANEAEKRHMVE
jgi:beta-galactosidase